MKVIQSIIIPHNIRFIPASILYKNINYMEIEIWSTSRFLCLLQILSPASLNYPDTVYSWIQFFFLCFIIIYCKTLNAHYYLNDKFKSFWTISCHKLWRYLIFFVWLIVYNFGWCMHGERTLKKKFWILILNENWSSGKFRHADCNDPCNFT
jgi:hypothetical protein